MMATSAPTEQAFAIIDNQDASPLFNIPLELRRAIYAHIVGISARHIYSVAVADSDGISRLRSTPCIAPGPFEADYLDGRERCPDKPVPGEEYPNSGRIFKRRLRSRWGRHWRCKDLAIRPQDCSEDALQAAFSRDSFSFLRVCKRM